MLTAKTITTRESEFFSGLFLLHYYEHGRLIGYGYVKDPQSKQQIRQCIEEIKYFFRENYIVETHKSVKKDKKKKSKRAK